MTAKLVDTLLRAVSHIEKFKGRAEDLMLSELNPPRSEDHKYLSVFYSENQFVDIVDKVVDKK